MASLSLRARPWGWLSPSGDPACRRLVVAGVAGILLTAPLSLQRLAGTYPAAGYLLPVVGLGLAVRCCARSWAPSARITWAATLTCLVFAGVTLSLCATQAASGLARTDVAIACTDDVSVSVVAGGGAVLHGADPYTAFNVLAAERSLGCPSYSLTPLRSGAFADRTSAPSNAELDRLGRAWFAGQPAADVQLGFDYPAGSALVGAAGGRGLIVVGVLALLAACVAVVAAGPPGRRRWLALALAAQAAPLVFVGQARPDAIVAGLLLVACARRGALTSGVALGLACAVKQTAWFVAPPLLILAFRRGRGAGLRQLGATAGAGRGAGLRQLGATAGAFAAVNLPFAAVNPGAWLQGVLAPQANPLFPLGGGPVALFTTGPHLGLVVVAFTVVMVMTVLAGCLLAWRGRAGWAEAGVVLAGLGLWDGPRSLLYYSALLGLVAVGVCARALLPRPRACADGSATATVRLAGLVT